MNTVQHKTETIIRHTLHMYAPVTARDLNDFVFQVDQIFEEVKGRKVEYDDDYYVTGDDEGLTVTFEFTAEGKS